MLQDEKRWLGWCAPSCPGSWQCVRQRGALSNLFFFCFVFRSFSILVLSGYAGPRTSYDELVRRLFGGDEYVTLFVIEDNK